jgi:hypothetical protein
VIAIVTLSLKETTSTLTQQYLERALDEEVDIPLFGQFFWFVFVDRHLRCNVRRVEKSTILEPAGVREASKTRDLVLAVDLEAFLGEGGADCRDLQLVRGPRHRRHRRRLLLFLVFLLLLFLLLLLLLGRLRDKSVT